MIDKQEILNKYKDKNDKIFVSFILDKINIYLNKDILVNTNFLNLNEFNIVISILNKFKIDYKVFSLNDNLERRCIALVPGYILDYKFDFIKCIKVKNKGIKLFHKDYMGSIYNIGINEDMIGDIIVKEDFAYIFVINKVLKYLEFNFDMVGNNKVIIEVLDYIPNVIYNFKEILVNVPSNRVDAILANVYNLSRKEVVNKISKSELYINSKCVKNNIYKLKYNDIVAFRRCGKFKYIDIIKTTKKGSLVIKINKYV